MFPEVGLITGGCIIAVAITIVIYTTYLHLR